MKKIILKLFQILDLIKSFKLKVFLEKVRWWEFLLMSFFVPGWGKFGPYLKSQIWVFPFYKSVYSNNNCNVVK